MQIGVERDDDASTGTPDAGDQRGALARVVLQAECSEDGILTRQSLEDSRRIVARPVVDEEDLVGPSGGFERLSDLLGQDG